jgi:adenylate kinase
MNIIILGPQGSGKGTQAKLLADKFNLFYFESGRFLRNLAKKDKRIRERINKGKLLDDEEMFFLLSSYLEKKDKKVKNIILDGYPRSIKQYKLLKSWLKKKGSKIDHAIALEVSKKESIRRLSARRVDKKTGKIYNLITNPPGPGVDKRNLIQREDDKPEVIKRRLDQYEKITLPLLKLLEKEGILIRVNGERPIKVIFEDILSCLKDRR